MAILGGLFDLPEASTLDIYLRAMTAARVHKRLQYRIKRVFDLIVAIGLLAGLAPLFLVIAASIKATSPGPIIYKQLRLKQNATEFTLLKFRTMVADAETKLNEVVHLNQASGPLFKARTDPRVTRVGRLLRRTFLDELPQLVNVVRGDMSLVGPRPILAREASQMERQFLFRFAVPQGITGPWQVSGHYGISIEEQLQVERHYVSAWSVTMDIAILARTMKLVVMRRGI